MNQDSSRDNRLAVVTGTSSGLGAAIAAALMQEGWNVVGLSRRPVDFGDPHYRHIQTDLADPERVREVADRNIVPLIASHPWRRIALVNNAASAGHLRSVEEADPSNLMRNLCLNAVAPIVLMGVFVRVVPPATLLRIVNISSGVATHPYPGSVDYGSSKAALRHAGRILAAELTSEQRPGGPQKNACILSYAPGVVETPMQDQLRDLGGPWNQMFVDFRDKGLLQPAELPAREVVSFLSGDSTEPFEERRFGDTRQT